MPFIGQDYENIRKVFRYQLCDLEHIKRSCDDLEVWTASTSNVTGIDYVSKVQVILNDHGQAQTALNTQLASGQSGIVSFREEDFYEVQYNNQQGAGSAMFDTAVRLQSAIAELELIFREYGLEFQQPRTVKT